MWIWRPRPRHDLKVVCKSVFFRLNFIFCSNWKQSFKLSFQVNDVKSMRFFIKILSRQRLRRDWSYVGKIYVLEQASPEIQKSLEWPKFKWTFINVHFFNILFAEIICYILLSILQPMPRREWEFFLKLSFSDLISYSASIEKVFQAQFSN